MTKKILILSSNPKQTQNLDLDKEMRVIEESLMYFKKDLAIDEFILEKREGVSPDDLQKVLLEVKPQIVHFCGHGTGQQGIVLENNAGGIHFASTEALTALFKIISEQIKCIECIVLNACYSEVQANAIVKHISYVIGMNSSILDSSAILFSQGFYNGIGAEQSVETAYELGKNRIQLEFPTQYCEVENTNEKTIERKLIPIFEDRDNVILPQSEHLIAVLKKKKIVESKPIKPIKSLIGPLEKIRAIAFSPNGKYLASASDDTNVRVWNLQTGKLVHLLNHPESVKCLCITKDSQFIISSSSNSIPKIKSSQIHVWELESGKQLNFFNISKNKGTVLRSITIDSLRKIVVTGCGSPPKIGTIKFWDWNTGKQKGKVFAHFNSVCSLTMSQDGKILVSGGKDKKIKIWHLDKGLDKDLEENQIVIEDAHDGDVLSLAISPSGQTLVSGGEDGMIKIWNLAAVEETPQIPQGLHTGEVNCVAISPDEKMLASAGADSTIRIRDLQTREILDIKVHDRGEVKTIAFSPDGKMLASGGEDRKINLWELNNLSSFY